MASSLCEVGLPAGVDLRQSFIRGDEVYTAAEDEAGTITVKRYRLVRRESGRALQTALPRGAGLELLDPPPGFRELLARELALGAKSPAEAASGDPAPVKTFRVRVRRRDGPQARTLTVQAESVQGARARALARAGSGWEIGDVEEA